jgi:chromosome segregation ATPase
MAVGGGRNKNKNTSKNKNKSQKQDRLSPPVNDGVANGGLSSGKDDEVYMSGKDGRIAVLQDLNKLLIEQIAGIREEKGTLEGKLTQMESRVNQNPSSREENGTLEEKLIQMQAQISSLEAQRTSLQSESDNLHAERVQLKEQLEESRIETEQVKEHLEAYEREMKSSHAMQNNLEATVLQLKDQIQVTSAELEVARKAWEVEKDDLLSQVVAARKEADEVTKASQMTEQTWKTDRENFLSSLRKSEKNNQKLHGKIDENQHLWNAEKINLEGTVVALQTKHDLIDNERKLLGQKNTELSTEVQFLKVQLNESESELNDSREETQDLCRKIKEDQHLWDAEKNNLEGTIGELKTKIDLMASENLSVSWKNGELSTEVESLKSLLNESKGVTQELHEKIEEGRNLWDAEKKNLEGTVAELKIKLDLMASERVSLSQKNGELSTKAESLKVQLNELQSKFNGSKGRTLELCREIEKDRCVWDAEKNNLEGSVAELKTKLHLIDGERELLSQKNTELSTEVQSLKTELVAAKLAYGEATVNLNKVKKEKEASDEKLMLQLSRNNVLEEELLSTKSSFEEMKESASKGEQQIANLQSQLVAVAEEKDGQIFDIQTKKNNLEGTVAKLKTKVHLIDGERELMSQKYTVLSTEVQSLKTELVAAKSAYDEATVHLTKIKEEKEASDEKLMRQLSRDKALEEELLLTKSSFEEMKESTSKGEQQIANLQSQLLAVAVEKDGQISEIQSQLSDMAEEKRSQLADLQEQFSPLAEAKMFLEEKNAELERRKLVLEEEKLCREGRIRELETGINSLYEDLEASRAMAVEKEGQLTGLQYQLSDLAEEKKCLEEKNNSLLTELNKCTLVSEEKVHLQHRIKELETYLDELESKLTDSKEKALELCSKIEKDRRQWDAEKNNLEGTVAEQQTKLDLIDIGRELLSQRNTELSTEVQSLTTELVAAKSAYDEATVHLNKIKEEKEALDEKLMLQISRNNALEEELLSTKSSFEEMKESASKGEQQIIKLQSQLLAVAEEKDGQIFDIQSRFSAMEEEKRGQLADLHDRLSPLAEAKMLLEEKNAKLERRQLVLEEEQLCLKVRIRELETAINSCNEDLQASRAMVVEKDGQLSALQYQLSDLAEEKNCLEEKTNSLLTELNECTLVSEEKVHLQDRIKELEIDLDSLNNDLKCRDIMLQKFRSEFQHSQSHECAENGKPNRVHAIGDSNGVPEKQKPKPAFEKQKPKRCYAWPALASTGALAAAAVTAYLKFSK